MRAGILTDQTAGRQESTKPLLVQSASILFSEKGYRAATLDEIARACAIQRGSIFYHFQSKQAIAIAAIDYFHKQCEKAIFHPILKQPGSSLDILKQLSIAIEKFFTDRPDRNLINFLGLELAYVSDDIAEKIDDFFTAWHTLFKRLFKKLEIELNSKDMQALVEHSMSLIQGFCTLNHVYAKSVKKKRIKIMLGNYLLELWVEKLGL
ncbi:MAG: hypothetical protein K0R12_198 [Gammaproteobacteria bacterium]|jgi:AcrR family transcriptional regulator|nr:hypothetical protein [Gammaproteobacteria bacterium]